MIDLTMNQTFRKGMEPDGNTLKESLVDTEILSNDRLHTESEKKYKNMFYYWFADDHTMVIDRLTTDGYHTTNEQRFSYLNNGSGSITIHGGDWSTVNQTGFTTSQFSNASISTTSSTTSAVSNNISFTGTVNFVDGDSVEEVGAFGISNKEPSLEEKLHTQVIGSFMSDFRPERCKTETVAKEYLKRFRKETLGNTESNDWLLCPEYTKVPKQSLRKLAGFVRNRLVDYLKENWFHITIPIFRKKYFSPEPEEEPTIRLRDGELIIDPNTINITTTIAV